MSDNPFLVPETNYKSTASIKENFNSDGTIPTDPEENPFLLKETTTEANPFLVQESKHNWGTTDARDKGKKNSAMSSKLTTAEAGDLGKKRLLPSLVEEINKPIFGAMALWDKGASALGGKETTAAQDWYGDTFMRQASRELEQTQREVSQFADKDAEFAYKIPETVGRLAGQMIYMAPGMQAAPALQKTLNGMVPTLVQRLGHESAQGILAGTPMAAAASSETYNRLINAGVPQDRALLAATVTAANTYLQVAAPVTVAGKLPTRVGVAGSFNVAGEKTEEQLINEIVSEWPNAQVQRTDVDSLISFVVGGTMGGALGKNKDTPKPKTADAQLGAEAEKYVADQAGLGKINPEAGMDFSGLKSPYYNQDGFSRGASPAQVKTANLYNDAAARNGKEQIAGTWDLDNKIINEREYNKPYWPDEDLQAGIAEANYRADNPDAIPDVDARQLRNPYLTPEQQAEAQRWADKDKPGYGEMDIPPEAGQQPYWPDAELEAAKTSANRRANSIDNLPQAAEVATDVDGIQSPYMNRQQLIDAQNQVDKSGEPVHSYMEIPEEMGNAPYWPDKPLERAKASANLAADKASQPLSPTKVQLTPEQHTQLDAKIVEALVPEKMSDEEAMARFLKIARKKQGGHIGWDLSENTGPGFGDLVEVTKKAARNLWTSVPESYRAQFKDAFFKDKEGTPTLLFHGSNSKGVSLVLEHSKDKLEKPFDKYIPDRGDGKMVHVGTADSATMINDFAIKNSRYIHTDLPYSSNLHEFPILSFKDWLLDADLGKNVLDLTPAEIKQQRDNWYKYRVKVADNAKIAVVNHTTKVSAELAATIKKYGTKKIIEVLSNPEAIYLYPGYKDLGISDKINDPAGHISKHFTDLGINTRNMSMFVDMLKDYLRRIKKIDDAVEELHADIFDNHMKVIDDHTIPMQHHMRPLFTSVKNPLMMKDVGAWNDLDAVTKELLPIKSQMYGAIDVSPLKPQYLLGETKGKEFTKDIVALREKHGNKLGHARSHFQEFHAILEKYGFDAIAYENRAEALNKEAFNTAEGTFHPPVISLGIWDASKIHDLVDIPRAPKGQRGSISLPGLGKESPKTPQTIDEAVELLNKDIGAERYIPMTVNQKALFLRNPVIKFVYDKMREFTNEADVRFNTYKTYLHDVETFLRNNRQESLKMLKVLVDIQDPALKDARKLAQESNTREAFLVEQGMPEKYVPMAIKILNVMQAVGKIDQKLALDAMGHNWHLEPMYFPREHTGPFTVTVVDSAGQVSYMKGFEHSKLAQQAATILKNKLKDTGYVVDLTRQEPNTMGDLYNMLNLNAPEKTPDFLKGITDGMLKEIEVSKRKFEMERAPHNIAGYTGETVYGSNNPLSGKYDQDTKLLTLLQRRLEGSFQLENKARLLTEIKKPLLDDPTTLMEFPNTNRMVKEMFAREFGLDISMFQVAGRRLDKVIEDGGKVVNNIMALAQGREAWDVSYFKPAEIARFTQAYVWTMSIFKLGLSPSTLMANTSTLLTTPIDGVRTAAREGVSQAVPLAATLKLMTSHLDPEAIKFMKEAKDEGMVEARLSDPLTITNTHARGAFDRAVNAPRDLIEKSTNHSALLYYYNFYKLAYPDMSPTSREFKTKVYEATRSWTGDYTHQSQLLAISKTGAAGNLMSNFAKWKFNQIGRLADDVRMLGEGKVLPFATTMAMTVLMAGAVGAPIAVEYEALRRLGMKIGWWDWKPLSAFLHELKDEGVMPEWAIKGPTTYVADEAAKELGLTAPDLSGNVRFSSVLDVNTLPFAFAGDVYKTLSGTARTVYKAANNAVGGTYPGNTVQQRKELFKGMPVVLENVWTERMNQEYGGESGVGQYSTKDMGQYPRSKQEQNLGYLGLRSKDENDYRDKDYARGWFDRKAKTDFTKYKDQIIANLNNPKNIEPLAQNIFELRGSEGIWEVIKTVEETLKNRQTDSYTRDLITQINNPNAIAQQRSLELLRKFRPKPTTRSLTRQ